MKNDFLESGMHGKCYGCSICVAFCPTHTISMQTNSQGFCYPKVNESKCINCGRCEEVCPYGFSKGKENGNIYQVANKSIDTLQKSQCGGVFCSASDIILKKQGVVYGAVFNDSDFSVCHTRAENAKERDRMCGSKYVQSIISPSLIEQLERDLIDGRDVLFSGTPCQCAMIQKNFGRYEKLIVCDFICHGVPSPKLWERYIEHILKREGVPIEKVRFRNKKCRGVGNHTESFWTISGKEILANDYAALYYSHLAHRESCFECLFAKRERVGDITMGGFLEPSDFDDPYDSSMLIINSDKGVQMFEEMKPYLNWEESKIEYYKNQPCLYRPVEKPDTYDKFWEDVENEDMEEIIKKYVTETIKEKYHINILTLGEDC